MKLLSLLSGGSVVLGASTVVDSTTLVPMTLLVAAILLTAKLAWSIATLYGSWKRRMRRLESMVHRLAEKAGVEFPPEDNDGPA